MKVLWFSLLLFNLKNIIKISNGIKNNKKFVKQKQTKRIMNQEETSPKKMYISYSKLTLSILFMPWLLSTSARCRIGSWGSPTAFSVSSKSCTGVNLANSQTLSWGKNWTPLPQKKGKINQNRAIKFTGIIYISDKSWLNFTHLSQIINLNVKPLNNSSYIFFWHNFSWRWSSTSKNNFFEVKTTWLFTPSRKEHKLNFPKVYFFFLWQMSRERVGVKENFHMREIYIARNTCKEISLRKRTIKY